MLRVLRDTRRPMEITEIAERLGVHANTVRFHLETLTANGQVEHISAERGVPGRPARLYWPVRGMDPKGPRQYLALAEALAESLAGTPDPRQRAIEAGRVWGRRQAEGMGTGSGDSSDAVTRLRHMLDELDFTPEQPTDTGGGRRRIDLRHCPFLELALERREVVCSLHLGLMRGAMEAWDSEVTVDRLDAFVEPDVCSAHLGNVRPLGGNAQETSTEEHSPHTPQ